MQWFCSVLHFSSAQDICCRCCCSLINNSNITVECGQTGPPSPLDSASIPDVRSITRSTIRILHRLVRPILVPPTFDQQTDTGHPVTRSCILIRHIHPRGVWPTSTEQNHASVTAHPECLAEMQLITNNNNQHQYHTASATRTLTTTSASPTPLLLLEFVQMMAFT